MEAIMGSTAAILRPDLKGRITLGKLAKGVSSFHITVNKDNSILLEPYAEIPAREKWIFDNPEALAQLKQGIKDSANGQSVDLGDFSHYINDTSSDD